MEMLHTLKFLDTLFLHEVNDPPNASQPLFLLPPTRLFPPVEGRKLARDANFLGGLLAVEVGDEDVVVEAGHVMWNKFCSLETLVIRANLLLFVILLMLGINVKLRHLLEARFKLGNFKFLAQIRWKFYQK